MLVIAAFAWSAWIPGSERTTGSLSASFLLLVVYPLALALLAAVYGRYAGNRHYYNAAAVDLVLWSIVVGPRPYTLARQFLAGLDYLLFGALSFLLAAVTSLLKTGRPQRWSARHRPA